MDILIHRVTSITVEHDHNPGGGPQGPFWVQRIRIVDDEGRSHIVSAFVLRGSDMEREIAAANAGEAAA